MAPREAVDGILVLQHGAIVYEKSPGVGPDDLHLLYSVSKALVATTLAVLEEHGKADLGKPVGAYIPELKQSAWAGTTVRDVVDMEDRNSKLHSWLARGRYFGR